MVPGQAPIVGQPRKLESLGISFDVQALPVEVPRASISTDYSSPARS
jgi:hypothetical protein